jgi:CBS domain-containing protein
MITDYRIVAPRDPLRRAVDLVLRGSQQDFPVVDAGRLSGVLTRADLLAALARHSEDEPVESVMRRDFQAADADDMLKMVLARLQECECHAPPVLHNGVLVGLVTADNLGEFLMIQAAVSRREAVPDPGFLKREAA